MNKTQQLSIGAIRALAIEQIENAKSGHPGLPLGAAPMVYELFANHLKHDPTHPEFMDRDRFILSAGHGSALLYSVLHLFGYEVTMDDLKNFRQFGSITTGHPEYGVCPGVETSTGPLGQGIANAVGFAIAEKMLAAKYNKDDLSIIDHYTYAFTGDGCLQEGIAYEAASLAGTLGLGKLILIYDKNDITIEGNINLTFSEDVGKRHEAMGWQVLYVESGEDIDAIGKAIEEAKKEKDKPSLIIVKTVIGFGSPKAGMSACHGAPLGKDGVSATKKALGYEYGDFEVPEEVRKHYEGITKKLTEYKKEHDKKLKEYEKKYPEDYKKLMTELTGRIKLDEAELYNFDAEVLSTRKAGNIVLNKLADMIPGLVGGSADLGPSNLTTLSGKGELSKDNPTGRYIHYGIREHAMAAIANGIHLHGGFRTYVSTFFAFSDYMKNAIRMSALMELPVTYIFTHDSIGVGEDGPTHQPVEHLTGLRSMPGLDVFRPADAKETAAAFINAIKANNPTAIVESRQDLPVLEGSGAEALRGGYVISDAKNFVGIIMASGSEVSIALEAQKILLNRNIKVRVVSMPCFRLFDEQTDDYKESVLPSSIRVRVAVEAGASMSWGKYVGMDGAYVCMDTFGKSAPAKKLFEYYGFTPENVASVTEKLIKGKK
ncbi:MAG: transketolase [Clostridiales bacterium]|nr:transketolase [Clostridiales bacterium]